MIIKTEVLTDEAIVERVRNGETALYELLMRRHNQKLYRVARGMGVDNDGCDDVLQQTYIQAYLKLHQFKGNSAFSTWLVRILINECLMDRRKARLAVARSGELIEQAERDELEKRPDDNPETMLMQHELRSLIERAISTLPVEYRSVYVMKEIEGMPVREIAEALQLTEVNVKVRLLRARTRLRNQLRKYLGKDELFEFGNLRCDAIVLNVLRSLAALE
jgi:RNA polymerase sigma-70 factor (ECF subfamily)